MRSPLLAMLLATSLVVVGGREGWSGWRPGPFSRRALTDLFREPRAPLAIGILATMATAPIYWLHYYVLSLIPSLWLLSASAVARSPAALAAAAVLMSSGAFGLLLWWLGWPGALPPSIALSWLPLWWCVVDRSSDIRARCSATAWKCGRADVHHGPRRAGVGGPTPPSVSRLLRWRPEYRKRS